MLHFGDAIGEHFSAFNFFHFFNVTSFSIPGMSITFNKTIKPPRLIRGGFVMPEVFHCQNNQFALRA